VATTTVMMPSHGKHSKEVDCQSDGTDEQELVGAHFWWIQTASTISRDGQKHWGNSHSLDGLKDNKYRDQYKKDSVGEAGEGFDASITKSRCQPKMEIKTTHCLPVGKPLIWLPGRHNGGEETNANGHAIECHVNGYQDVRRGQWASALNTHRPRSIQDCSSRHHKASARPCNIN
jgi:hypothetical protein